MGGGAFPHFFVNGSSDPSPARSWSDPLKLRNAISANNGSKAVNALEYARIEILLLIPVSQRPDRVGEFLHYFNPEVASLFERQDHLRFRQAEIEICTPSSYRDQFERALMADLRCSWTRMTGFPSFERLCLASHRALNILADFDKIWDGDSPAPHARTSYLQRQDLKIRF
jgi:hypothetical protein